MSAPSFPMVDPGPDVPTYMHISGLPGEGWRPYTPEQSRIIEFAWRARKPVVKLPPPAPGLELEIRFGRHAVSAKVLVPPSTGLLQVNVRSQNSRRVRRGAPAEDGGGDDPAASAALDPAAGVAANQAADTLLPQKVADAAIRCMAACYELIDTEALYVAKLDLMVHVFAIPLREHIAMCIAAGTPNSSCITENEHRRLFGAIESILMIHAGFQDPKDESKNEAGIHAELRAAWDAAEAASFKGGGVAKAVADVLAKNANQLRFYTPHLQGVIAAQELHGKLMEQRPVYKELISILELQPKVKTIHSDPKTVSAACDLKSLIIEPFQRLTRYNMILKEVQEHARRLLVAQEQQVGPDGEKAAAHPKAMEYCNMAPGTVDALTAAIDIVFKVGMVANSKQDESANQMEALRIFTDVLRKPEMMHNSGRVLKQKWVQDGSLLSYMKGSSKAGSKLMRSLKSRKSSGGTVNSGASHPLVPKPRHVYLFTDLLVISNPDSGTVHFLPLKDLCVLTNDRIFCPAWDSKIRGTGVWSQQPNKSTGKKTLAVECIECWHLEPLARCGDVLPCCCCPLGGKPLAQTPESGAFTEVPGMSAGFAAGLTPDGILPPDKAAGAIVVAAKGRGVFILHADNLKLKEEFVGAVLQEAAHNWASGSAGGGVGVGAAADADLTLDEVQAQLIASAHPSDNIVKSLAMLGQFVADNTEKMHMGDLDSGAFLDTSDSSVDKFMAAAMQLGHPMEREVARVFIEKRGMGKDLKEVLGYLKPMQRMPSIKMNRGGGGGGGGVSGTAFAASNPFAGGRARAANAGLKRNSGPTVASFVASV